jgi:hypothetical protein
MVITAIPHDAIVSINASFTHRRSINMSIGWKSLRGFLALTSLPILGIACQQESGITAPEGNSAMLKTNGAVAAVGSVNGAAGQMPAFYDGNLFIVNMKELPEQASASTIAHNGNINEIYASNDLDDPQDFFPVIDAIQGDGFNPLWHQNLIVFNQGFTPHQFTSDEDVLAAAAGPNPEITIVVTDEVYRCSVVGRKN